MSMSMGNKEEEKKSTYDGGEVGVFTITVVFQLAEFVAAFCVTGGHLPSLGLSSNQ